MAYEYEFKPEVVSLDRLLDATAYSVSLAMVSQPSFASSGSQIDPGTTTGIWQEPIDP